MDSGNREVWRWLAGPVLFILALSGISVGARLVGISSGVFGILAPGLAFVIAWAAWWPIFRPRIDFWLFVVSGAVVSVLVVLARVAIAQP